MNNAKTLGRRLAAVEGQRSGSARVRVFMTPRPMDDAELAAWQADKVRDVKRGETVVVIRRFYTEAAPEEVGEIGRRLIERGVVAGAT